MVETLGETAGVDSMTWQWTGKWYTIDPTAQPTATLDFLGVPLTMDKRVNENLRICLEDEARLVMVHENDLLMGVCPVCRTVYLLNFWAPGVKK